MREIKRSKVKIHHTWPACTLEHGLSLLTKQITPNINQWGYILCDCSYWASAAENRSRKDQLQTLTSNRLSSGVQQWQKTYWSIVQFLLWVCWSGGWCVCMCVCVSKCKAQRVFISLWSKNEYSKRSLLRQVYILAYGEAVGVWI